MKTILLATDFSTASRNAGRYGLELAKTFNARMVLFNAYQQMPFPVTEAPVFMEPEEIKNITRQLLEEEATALNMGSSVHIDIACNAGPATEAILKAVEETNADMVIVGMKEETTGFLNVFGSTVTALARKTATPMIVVPENTNYTPATTIALANESDLAPGADSHLLGTLHELAEQFHSKVYLVRVASNKFHEAYEVLNHPFKLSRILKTFNPVYECIEGKDIPKALNDFIDSYQIDMLALMPHKYTLPERLFVKSVTRSMIFKTHIPLLILPDMHKAIPGYKASIKEALL
jgi:nucleotide-binding universal stress UspA family protein